MKNVEIKKPTLRDIIDIQSVLEPYVKEGVILKRDDDEVATNIRSYTLVYNEKKPVGVAALHVFSPFLGEIRSLAVDKDFQGKGLGKLLVDTLLKEAKELGLKEVLVLTYKREFFEKLGFIEIDKEAIPDKKIWADCIKCKFFPNCNEIALIKYL
ncbi:amino-acid acetyltransferase [Nautilia profundicola AmH]|uniref:Amino-acid acetyltransferase n=1 Tax=Nautilia profundicola (strain ATCC BAA-1463 / DSM 18972 / AmH) TaxID=598659 RepID=B9LAC9_NAUPA|nr:N-acetyltransferase [Nautilia profundicola]ACM92739.1 amino-acid acetyltransferase [Nautilia profundicola AmH]